MKIVLKLTLPDWLSDLVDYRKAYPEIEDRMRLVISLARKNIEMGTESGGSCKTKMAELPKDESLRWLGLF